MNNAGQKNLIFMIDNSGCAAFAWLEMAGIESSLLSSVGSRPRRTWTGRRPALLPALPKAPSFLPADDPPLLLYPFRDLNHL